MQKSIAKAEVEYVSRLVVNVRTSIIIGRTLIVDDLLESGYDAAFVGRRAGSPSFMSIHVENLNKI